MSYRFIVYIVYWSWLSFFIYGSLNKIQNDFEREI